MCLSPNTPLGAGDEFEDDDVENEEDDEVDIAQIHFEFKEMYRAKWMLDNCKTITDMIDRLREEAHRLTALRDSGWKLEDDILDDYGYLVPPDLEERVAAAIRARRLPVDAESH